MKVSECDYQILRRNIIAFLERNPRIQTESAGLYQSAGYSPKRLRWDILRNAGLMPFVVDTLYKDYEDSHIDTALRTVMRSVGITWAAGA